MTNLLYYLTLRSLKHKNRHNRMDKYYKTISITITILGILITGITSYNKLGNDIIRNKEIITLNATEIYNLKKERQDEIKQAKKDKVEALRQRQIMDNKLIDALDGVKVSIGDLKTSNAVTLVRLDNVKSQLNSIIKKIKK